MVKGVLLDLSGVMYDGGAAIPGAREALGRLREAGLPVRFITNSTRRPRRRIMERLRKMRLEVEDGEVLTPAASACGWLRQEGYTPHLLVHPDLEEDFAGAPEEGKPAVVLGDAGRFFTYERMNAAFRVLADGAPFLALAANRVFRDEDGELSLDAGAFVRALEFSSGTEAQLFGKPSEAFFHAGAAQLGCAPGNVAMIGDDAESDVAGALGAGIGLAVLVRTGKYRDGDEDRFEPRPSAVARDVGEAVEMLLR